MSKKVVRPRASTRARSITEYWAPLSIRAVTSRPAIRTRTVGVAAFATTKGDHPLVPPSAKASVGRRQITWSLSHRPPPTAAAAAPARIRKERRLIRPDMDRTAAMRQPRRRLLWPRRHLVAQNCEIAFADAK